MAEMGEGHEMKRTEREQWEKEQAVNAISCKVDKGSCPPEGLVDYRARASDPSVDPNFMARFEAPVRWFGAAPWRIKHMRRFAMT